MNKIHLSVVVLYMLSIEVLQAQSIIRSDGITQEWGVPPVVGLVLEKHYQNYEWFQVDVDHTKEIYEVTLGNRDVFIVVEIDELGQILHTRRTGSYRYRSSGGHDRCCTNSNKYRNCQNRNLQNIRNSYVYSYDSSPEQGGSPQPVPIKNTKKSVSQTYDRFIKTRPMRILQ